MKVFIIHASAGSGHKKVAEAIYEEAAVRFGKENVRLFDILDYTPRFFKFLYSQGYLFLIAKMQWLWKFFFWLSDFQSNSVFNRKLRTFFNSAWCARFLKFIKNEKPDIIISTHFLVNEQVSYLKEQKATAAKLVTVITDFGVHGFWIADNVDTYCVACQKTKEILLTKGVAESKIRLTGIPIRKQFLKQMQKDSLKRSFGIDNNLFTVFVLTGGVGIGPIYEIAKLFNDEINVIVVCGNNTKLSQRLSTLNFKHLVTFGWIDNVEEVMCVADAIITKPGGSSVSESLVMGLPMFFFSIIPGQESYNALTMNEYGVGFTVAMAELKEEIYSLKDDPVRYGEIKKKFSIFSNNNAVQKVISCCNE